MRIEFLEAHLSGEEEQDGAADREDPVAARLTFGSLEEPVDDRGSSPYALRSSANASIVATSRCQNSPCPLPTAAKEKHHIARIEAYLEEENHE